MNFRQEPHAKLSDASAASPAGLERSGATNCNEVQRIALDNCIESAIERC